MRIFCEGPNDYKLACALESIARVANVSVRVNRADDSYAITVWSIDDVEEILNDRGKKMSRDAIKRFMKQAEAQLHTDMVERGQDSLDTLVDEYCTDNELQQVEENELSPVTDESGCLTLDEVLVKYFGSGYPLPESPSCESYDKLISLVYDIGKVIGEDVNSLVDSLDEVSSLDSFRDEAGELVYDNAEILRRRAQNEADDGEFAGIANMISAECSAFREKMLKKTPEEIYRNAYYINIVENVEYFFQEKQEDEIRSEEYYAFLVEAVAKGSFVKRFIGEWVDTRDSVDFSTLEATGLEIEGFCKACVAAHMAQ